MPYVMPRSRTIASCVFNFIRRNAIQLGTSRGTKPR